jgi:hypothetical protein
MFGIDYLGGGRYGDVILKNHPKGWAAGFIYDLDGFGPALPVIDKLAAKAITPIIRTHLVYKDNHKFGRSELELAVARAIEFKPVIEKHLKVCNFDISPYLEQQLTDKAFLDETFARIKSILPFCNLVNSPIKPGIFYPGAVNEIHSAETYPLTQPLNYGHDGMSAFDTDMQTLKQKYFYVSRGFYIWIPPCNGKRNTKGDSPNDDDRSRRKFWLRAEHFPHILYLTTEKGNTGLKEHWIGKAQGDQHNVEPKGNDLKPVLIAPFSNTRLGLRAGGRVISSSTAPVLYKEGRYPVKRYIYRFGTYGYLLGEQARQLQGHSVCEVIDLNTKKVYGRWNPGFRERDYRPNG